ncbi:nitroreductase family protein [Ruminococcaceae bacterium OttesenSCG-928-A11]|nr:nitroreductase family protein [Ruminococcaceae bacterium OttesenSCG-928-A11]
MNQTLEAIQNRFSCRAFTGAMPEAAQIEAIAQAAIQSPSAVNKQRWQVIVVRDAGLIAELEAEGLRVMAAMPDQTMFERIQSRGGKLFYSAPCVIFVPIDPAELTGAALDCGIVCQTIALAAQAQGLASCICGLAGLAFAEGKAAYFKEKLAFPAGYEFGAAVLIGTAAAPGTPHTPDPAKITYIG